jgi:hypothetical protein
MTDDELHDAIDRDDRARALADAGDDAGCAARMMAVLPPVAAEYVPVRTLIYWGALTGVRARIQHAQADDTSPVQALALSYMDLIRDQDSPGLSVTDPAVVGPGGMLDAFAAAGVFAADGPGSKADLVAQAPTTPAVVTTDDVSRAWARHRPGGKVGG